MGPTTMQVLDALRAAGSADATAEASAIEQMAAPAREPLVAPPVRVLVLRLSPGSLGTVNIVLTGNSDALRIRVEAEREATASALEVDRTALAGALATSGQHLDELVISRLVPPSTTALETGSSPPPYVPTPDAMSGGFEHLRREGREPDERRSGSPASQAKAVGSDSPGPSRESRASAWPEARSAGVRLLRSM